jgi:hypothetical protein
MTDLILNWIKDQPGWVAAIAGTATALWAVGKRTPRIVGVFRRIGHAVDDLVGHPARDGAEEKPGALAILHQHAEELGHIKAEVQFNHGGSLKDAVVGVRTDFQELDRRVDRRLTAVEARFDGLDDRLDAFTTLLAAAISGTPPTPKTTPNSSTPNPQKGAPE